MLKNPLQQLPTPDALAAALKNNEQVVICCGRMGPMCLPAYAALNERDSKLRPSARNPGA